MDKNILKIDTDTETLKETLDMLKQRLSYLNDLDVLHIDKIDKIIAGKKENWNVKIYLNIEMAPEFIILFQSILGSDWRKETNTLLNHYKLGMKYSNRMFDIKQYSDGSIKHAKHEDITIKIKKYIMDTKRVRWNN